MQRTITLVELTWSRDKDPRLPLGHASLLASLRQVSNLTSASVIIPVNGPKQSPQHVAAQILSQIATDDPANTDVAIGAYVWAEHLLRDVLTALRHQGFTGRIILGGPQISYCAGGLEALYPEADAFIRGYGEQALRTLALSPNRTDIIGVHWAGTPDLNLQAQANLDVLPSPWLTNLIPLQNQPFVRWETQRGCPFRCSFCQHREAGKRLTRRTLNSARIAAEIDLFCEHNVTDIAVLDPIFNMAPHATNMLERFADRGFTGRLSLQCRAEAIDESFLDAASALNTRLEFGLQTIHPGEGKAVRRHNNLAKVEQALSRVRGRGIDHEISVIFGLPLQTVASFEQTLQWCLAQRVPVIKAFPLLLLRGTALDQERERWGFIDDGGSMPMVVQSVSFSHADWVYMAQLSEALSLTEGHHPSGLDELRRLAADLQPKIQRWKPTQQEMAA